EHHHIKFFRVFCPKAFAVIGGLKGALLDRCIVIHLEKVPSGIILASTRENILEKDAKELLRQLAAYREQKKDILVALYEAEPDEGYWPSLQGREAELWAPLLLHARIFGPHYESRALRVAHKFSGRKLEITISDDLNLSQARELLYVLENLKDKKFSPGDL